MNNTIMTFWAKTSEEGDQWHALLWHLIDSGIVAKTLWDDALSESIKANFAEMLSLETDRARDLFAFWVSLHDIGKAGPAFQRKSVSGMKRVENAGFHFPSGSESIPGYHGFATTWILEDYFKESSSINVRFTNALALALGGHHGEFPSSNNITETAYRKFHLGDTDWKNAQNQLIAQLSTIFKPPTDWNPPQGQDQVNTLLFLLTGLTTTADWIASNNTFFYYDPTQLSLEEYLALSQKEASTALPALEWGGWKASGEPPDFFKIFPFPPNDLQISFIKETRNLISPFLVILEAPTGSGKTESALFLADTVLQKEHKSGFYIAMPSQATSNQMFERTFKFLKERYPQDRLNVQLVHGSALINESFKQLRINGVNQDVQKDEGQITGTDWFLPRKKSLLAPFGIGTVDQAFLSVMRCKHFYMRLFGLAHKVVIFDEVHAYDVYMLEIFKRLLSWLHAVNTSVVILSATLPASSRQEMIEAYSGHAEDVSPVKIEFPRVSISTINETRVVSLGKAPSNSVSLQWLKEENLISVLKEKLAMGGHAAIICNRVDHVIEIYEKLVEVFPKDEWSVFHSRFPYCWREVIEEQVKRRYGKDLANRPKSRSIVIATQVIEQSLDLDFDLMVSDLAPVDLLIQRIGRLHRHASITNPPSRPQTLVIPQVLFLLPNLENLMPTFGSDKHIYDPYILQRTWFVLQNKSELLLPEQTDCLIEKVYSGEYIEEIPLELWPEMQKAMNNMLHKEDNEALKASNQLVQNPGKKILGNLQPTFSEGNDPGSLSVMQTLTRNASASVQLVCLVQTPQGLVTLDQSIPVNLDLKPDFELIIACQRSTLTVTNHELVDHFLTQRLPSGWRKSSVLRSHIPVIFKEGIYENGDIHLILDREKGLCHEKKRKELKGG